MSDIKTLEIPKWGLSMEEGTIAQWLIQEGEQFSKGQEICEIETTKIINVLEAPFASTLRKIIANNGDTLVVGGVIAVCADADVSDADIDAYVQSLGQNHQAEHSAEPEPQTPQQPRLESIKNQPPANVEKSSKAEAPQKTTLQPNSSNQKFVIPEALQGFNDSESHFSTPHALKLAKEHNVNLAAITGSGREGRISVKDIQATVQEAGGVWSDIQSFRETVTGKPVKSTQDDSNVPATPVARRLAEKWGINLHDCRVSGSRGRVCKDDVEAVYYRHQPTEKSSACASVEPSAEPATKTIVMSGMRKAIAARLQAAKRNAPHFRLTIDLNVEAMQNLRQQINATVPQVKLSINDMLIKAAATALMKVPQVNVQYDEANQQIIQFEQADISVAVAIHEGLITPIIKAANRKSLAEISTDMRDLATRAKTGKLAPDEFQGGSFSISNLGMLGIQQFDAIINPPQGAILALGAAEQRAVVENGQIVIRQLVTATLSCDHRVIDGALGAQFLAALRQYVENPALILV